MIVFHQAIGNDTILLEMRKFYLKTYQDQGRMFVHYLSNKTCSCILHRHICMHAAYLPPVV
jgi:hypothetical protein